VDQHDSRPAAVLLVVDLGALCVGKRHPHPFVRVDTPV
jgi:hypothetical protein